MIGTIGFVLNSYHTELLDYLFELVYKKYNIILYLENDDYNNLELLRNKYKFVQKSILKYFIGDYKNDVCFKYVVLSHSDSVILNLKQYNFNHDKILFLVHNLEEMSLLKESFDNFEYFIVSNQLDGDCMVPLSNEAVIKLIDHYAINMYNANNTNRDIHIVKIGWVLNVDQSIYDKILSLKNIKMTIFTQGPTKDLEIMFSKHKNLSIQFAKDTKYIYNYIMHNNIRFVLHVPNSVGVWSGSISLALNNNMILLTNNEAISNYDIPSGYCLSYESDNLEMEVYKKYFIDTRDENILQKYRNQITMKNLSIFEEKLKIKK